MIIESLQLSVVFLLKFSHSEANLGENIKEFSKARQFVGNWHAIPLVFHSELTHGPLLLRYQNGIDRWKNFEIVHSTSWSSFENNSFISAELKVASDCNLK